MLSFNASQRYYLSIGGVDMRKSYNGLSGVVRQGLGRDPMSGEVFIFMNRRRMIMKLLVWDRSGWVIWLPQLPDGDKGLELRWEELVLILEGVRLRSVRKRKRYEVEKMRATG